MSSERDDTTYGAWSATQVAAEVAKLFEPPASILINGEAVIVGPNDRLVISVPAEHTTVDDLNRMAEQLRERFGERFIVFCGDQTVTVMRSEP